MADASDPTAAQTGTQFNISPARSEQDMRIVTSLFTFYAASLNIDLSFQSFQAELESLPGKYAPQNGGEILLARSSSGEPIGCVALRSLGPEACCEMKRLYVAPAGRGLGLGKALATAIIDLAREFKYRTMKLDTLPTMTAALALYRTRFLAKEL
ncbi:MAG: hypothetical protein Q9225_006594 [Loekoesia sp. 1 TL-2023]